MRKQKTMMKKVNSAPIPMYPTHYANIIKSIKDDEVFQVVFSKPSKSKTPEQLGYYHGWMVPKIECYLIDHGYTCLYTEQFKDFSVEVKITGDSIDYFFKKMYEKHIGKPFQKREADKDQMREFIAFVDSWCAEKLGYAIPEPPQRRENNG